MPNVLIVVDMQADFVTGALGSAAAQAIVPAVAQRIQLARQTGESIYFTFDTHHADYLQTAEGAALPVPHCIAGTPGHALAEGIISLDADTLIEKPTFGSQRLADALYNLALRTDCPDGRGLRVELCGVCTDICVVTNALLIKTRLPEADVCVSAALCAGTSPENHTAALTTMGCCQIKVS